MSSEIMSGDTVGRIEKDVVEQSSDTKVKKTSVAKAAKAPSAKVGKAVDAEGKAGKKGKNASIASSKKLKRHSSDTKKSNPKKKAKVGAEGDGYGDIVAGSMGKTKDLSGSTGIVASPMTRLRALSASLNPLQLENELCDEQTNLPSLPSSEIALNEKTNFTPSGRPGSKEDILLELLEREELERGRLNCDGIEKSTDIARAGGIDKEVIGNDDNVEAAGLADGKEVVGSDANVEAVGRCIASEDSFHNVREEDGLQQETDDSRKSKNDGYVRAQDIEGLATHQEADAQQPTIGEEEHAQKATIGTENDAQQPTIGTENDAEGAAPANTAPEDHHVLVPRHQWISCQRLAKESARLSEERNEIQEYFTNKNIELLNQHSEMQRQIINLLDEKRELEGQVKEREERERELEKQMKAQESIFQKAIEYLKSEVRRSERANRDVRLESKYYRDCVNRYQSLMDSTFNMALKGDESIRSGLKGFETSRMMEQDREMENDIDAERCEERDGQDIKDQNEEERQRDESEKDEEDEEDIERQVQERTQNSEDDNECKTPKSNLHLEDTLRLKGNEVLMDKLQEDSMDNMHQVSKSGLEREMSLEQNGKEQDETESERDTIAESDGKDAIGQQNSDSCFKKAANDALSEENEEHFSPSAPSLSASPQNFHQLLLRNQEHSKPGSKENNQDPIGSESYCDLQPELPEKTLDVESDDATPDVKSGEATPGVKSGGATSVEKSAEIDKDKIKTVEIEKEKPSLTLNEIRKQTTKIVDENPVEMRDPVETSIVKTDDTKAADAKADNAKTGDTKTDDAKTDDTKADDIKTDDAKTDDTKADDIKTDDAKTNDAKTNDAKTDDAETEASQNKKKLMEKIANLKRMQREQEEKEAAKRRKIEDGAGEETQNDKTRFQSGEKEQNVKTSGVQDNVTSPKSTSLSGVSPNAAGSASTKLQAGSSKVIGTGKNALKKDSPFSKQVKVEKKHGQSINKVEKANPFSKEASNLFSPDRKNPFSHLQENPFSPSRNPLNEFGMPDPLNDMFDHQGDTLPEANEDVNIMIDGEKVMPNQKKKDLMPNGEENLMPIPDDVVDQENGMLMLDDDVSPKEDDDLMPVPDDLLERTENSSKNKRPTSNEDNEEEEEFHHVKSHMLIPNPINTNFSDATPIINSSIDKSNSSTEGERVKSTRLSSDIELNVKEKFKEKSILNEKKNALNDRKNESVLDHKKDTLNEKKSVPNDKSKSPKKRSVVHSSKENHSKPKDTPSASKDNPSKSKDIPTAQRDKSAAPRRRSPGQGTSPKGRISRACSLARLQRGQTSSSSLYGKIIHVSSNTSSNTEVAQKNDAKGQEKKVDEKKAGKDSKLKEEVGKEPKERVRERRDRGEGNYLSIGSLGDTKYEAVRDRKKKVEQKKEPKGTESKALEEKELKKAETRRIPSNTKKLKGAESKDLEKSAALTKERSYPAKTTKDSSRVSSMDVNPKELTSSTRQTSIYSVFNDDLKRERSADRNDDQSGAVSSRDQKGVVSSSRNRNGNVASSRNQNVIGASISLRDWDADDEGSSSLELPTRVQALNEDKTQRKQPINPSETSQKERDACFEKLKNQTGSKANTADATNSRRKVDADSTNSKVLGDSHSTSRRPQPTCPSEMSQKEREAFFEKQKKERLQDSTPILAIPRPLTTRDQNKNRDWEPENKISISDWEKNEYPVWKGEIREQSWEKIPEGAFWETKEWLDWEKREWESRDWHAERWYRALDRSPTGKRSPGRERSPWREGGSYCDARWKDEHEWGREPCNVREKGGKDSKGGKGKDSPREWHDDKCADKGGPKGKDSSGGKNRSSGKDSSGGKERSKDSWYEAKGSHLEKDAPRFSFGKDYSDFGKGEGKGSPRRSRDSRSPCHGKGSGKGSPRRSRDSRSPRRGKGSPLSSNGGKGGKGEKKGEKGSPRWRSPPGGKCDWEKESFSKGDWGKEFFEKGKDLLGEWGKGSYWEKGWGKGPEKGWDWFFDKGKDFGGRGKDYDFWKGKYGFGKDSYGKDGGEPGRAKDRLLKSSYSSSKGDDTKGQQKLPERQVRGLRSQLFSSQAIIGTTALTRSSAG